ncbi:MAG: ABC transporter substrate-binding protein [Planctomycetes bacterium]|nr:ABC transporter substrate-binding protein [Planctomycetota bacterium]
MSTALTGPTRSLGENMRAGVLAAFEEVNRKGGIEGAPLELICLDDGYEPALTIPNMMKLIHEDKVMAIIGNVGTPTSVTAIPLAQKYKTLFYGAFTGAGALRRNGGVMPYVINYRASYAEETAAMVKALIKNKLARVDEVAFFTQRDAYGDDGFLGGLRALIEQGLEDNNVIHARYERNTLAVEGALADFLTEEKPPKAIIMVGAYAPCAAFVRLAKKHGLDALFLNVSFVGANALAKKLGEEGDGVVITQVVPHIDSDLPTVKAYKQALSSWNEAYEPSFVSLEGYISARILIESMERYKGDRYKRRYYIKALESLGKFDLGLGAPLNLDSQDHQASHMVWPTYIKDSKVQPLNWQGLLGLNP